MLCLAVNVFVDGTKVKISPFSIHNLKRAVLAKAEDDTVAKPLHTSEQDAGVNYLSCLRCNAGGLSRYQV